MQKIKLDFSDNQTTFQIFNRAFQNPDEHFEIEPTDPETARQWLEENTWMVHFVWCGGAKSFEERIAEGGPMKYGQVVGGLFDYLRMRCGWVGETSESCAHPTEDESYQGEVNCEGDRLCCEWQCPIANEALNGELIDSDPEYYNAAYFGVDDIAEVDREEYSGEMILHSRPRYAYVPNVTVLLGCEDIRRR